MPSGIWLNWVRMFGLEFSRTIYSEVPSRAVPAGTMMFDCCSVLTTSCGAKPLADSFIGSRSMVIWRFLPPNGPGIETPGIGNRRRRTVLSAISTICCSGTVLLDMVSWMTGTLEALKGRIEGGVMPGGAWRRIELLLADIWAMALPMLVPGWK